MAGTPQQPDPNRATYKLPLRVNFDGPDTDDVAAPVALAPNEPYIRRTAITAEMLREYGYTEGCHGCRQKAAGLDARRNTETCHARIWEAMDASDIYKRRKDAQENRFAHRRAAREEEVHESAAAGAEVVHGPF